MANSHRYLAVSAWLLMLSVATAAHGKKGLVQRGSRVENTDAQAVLWRDPSDIQSRNLFYGSGGPKDQPHGRLVFESEDLKGSNPKFDARDADGVKWKVKLGTESRPETAASRFVWALGYFTEEDYFIPDLHVDELPARLHRGQEWVLPGGRVISARLKRAPDDAKKAGEWKWKKNPFTGTRELNGLRVLMALMNNWDLKDENNAIYKMGDRDFYVVSDLGASFGTNGLERLHEEKKGNAAFFAQSRFIIRLTPATVSFETPRRPCKLCAVDPKEFFFRLGLRWIGRNIPREDARWAGSLLARLSRDQIRDAFRAAKYSPADIEQFTKIIQQRIAILNTL